MATARQWQPRIKSRAQVKRKRAGLHFAKRGKVRYHRHERENPLDFATSLESQEIATLTENLAKLFGVFREIETPYRPRRGRRSNLDKLLGDDIDLDTI